MKTVKYISLALAALIGVVTNASAQIVALKEKETVIENGFEYGYTINNEQTKDVKGESYSRYEVTVFITNKTGCTKLFAIREKTLTSNNDGNKLANFDCLNATGKRLTSKKASIEAREFYVNTTIKVGDKEETKATKAGLIFRTGETLRNQFIVIVPLNERPQINCNINHLIEL